jgi:uncharacterized protein
LVLAVLLTIGSGSVVRADFYDGYTAYQSKDYATAFRIWKPLAEQGNGSSAFNIGVMYENGQGFVANSKMAVFWYRKAAAYGDTSAQNRLGWMYEQGYGVLPDIELAHMWYNVSGVNGLKAGANNRNRLDNQWFLNSQRFDNARRLARKCLKQNNKNCGK